MPIRTGNTCSVLDHKRVILGCGDVGVSTETNDGEVAFFAGTPGSPGSFNPIYEVILEFKTTGSVSLLIAKLLEVRDGLTGPTLNRESLAMSIQRLEANYAACHAITGALLATFLAPNNRQLLLGNHPEVGADILPHMESVYGIIDKTAEQFRKLPEPT